LPSGIHDFAPVAQLVHLGFGQRHPAVHHDTAVVVQWVALAAVLARQVPDETEKKIQNMYSTICATSMY
jgi:hypothetical protein